MNGARQGLHLQKAELSSFLDSYAMYCRQPPSDSNLSPEGIGHLAYRAHIIKFRLRVYKPILYSIAIQSIITIS